MPAEEGTPTNDQPTSSVRPRAATNTAPRSLELTHWLAIGWMDEYLARGYSDNYLRLRYSKDPIKDQWAVVLYSGSHK